MIEKYREAVTQETIGGIVYSSSKFPAMQSVALLARVVQILGEQGLRALLSVFTDENADLEIDDAITELRTTVAGRQAIVKIAAGLADDPGLPLALCERLKASRLRPGNAKGGPVAPAFDAHFAGELPHLFQVLLFVLLHNYVGFTLGFHSESGSLTGGGTGTDSSSDFPIPSGD